MANPGIFSLVATHTDASGSQIARTVKTLFLMFILRLMSQTARL
jgi:hypothetical protein